MLQTLFPGERPVFQDDNAPVHTSRCVQTWLHEHDDEVEHLTWCPRSPDLNIIEPLWGYLENKVRAPFPPPRTLFELETVLHEESVQIPMNFVQDLYFSIPRRMQAVIQGFISVKDTYGKDSVTKYECIGHVQKRVGARLRKLKSKNKNLSGKGKLTDSFIDRMQNYYGIAVLSNVGNLSGLQQNVIAALFHCSSSVEKPMHGQCPIGKDSWCYYQRALSCGKKPNEKYKALSNEVLNTIKPTYLELCTKELFTKCLHGKT
ncbi:uncharacterized protein TNCV_4728611 [Trichonephila clavipes]|nr:uncharacterized protein TNCV_4728611 [Trichonephila clavipes]